MLFECPRYHQYHSGVVDCYRSMRSFERLTLNVRSKIHDLCAHGALCLAPERAPLFGPLCNIVILIDEEFQTGREEPRDRCTPDERHPTPGCRGPGKRVASSSPLQRLITFLPRGERVCQNCTWGRYGACNMVATYRWTKTSQQMNRNNPPLSPQ